MKILVVDRDASSANLIKSRLAGMGHDVVVEPVKNNAIEMLSSGASGDFDVVFLDPSPLTSARPFILDMRRQVSNHPYLFLMSEHENSEEVLREGVHDVYPKPMNLDGLDYKIANAERFIGLVQQIGDTREDFPSAGGIISKSAFCQLFLSGIDRADRYGECTYILFITVENYEKLIKLNGAPNVDGFVADLARHIVINRRQSDIIGQTRKNEYALLLQRPAYEREPVDAANRFTQVLAALEFVNNYSLGAFDVRLTLVDLPAANMIVEHVISYGDDKGAKIALSS